MSLIAWYPLNGDAKDYSGNENHIVSGTYTENISGKIGKCFEAGGTYSTVLKTPITTNKLSDNVTISFWIFNTKQNGTIAIFGNKGNDNTSNASSPQRTFNYFLYPTPTDFHFSCSRYQGVLENVIPYNKWTHITTVQTSNKFIIYINGIKKKIVDITPTPKNDYSLYIGGGDNGNSTCKFNDVRIYNEALTAKQIKEIAQAKICHYTFNEEMYENTTNLYANFPELSGMVTTDNNDYKIDRIKLGNGHYRYKIYKKVTKNNWPNVQFPVYTFIPGKQYTISIDIKIIEKRNKARIQLRHSAINNDYGTPGRQTISLTNAVWGQWKRYTLTRSFETTTTLNGATHNTSPRIEIYTDMHNEGDYLEFEIKNYQVEEKDHATPFTPNSRTQKLKDISGYGHHMTTYTKYSPVWKQDNFDNRIKGYSALIDKSSYYCENFKYKYPDAFTFSCWIKTTDNEAFCILGFPNGNNANMSMAIKGGMLSLHSYGASPNANSDQWYATSKKAINDNVWHLLTMVYDGTTAKSYIDGKYETSSTVTFDFQRHPAQHLSINMTSPTSNFGDYEKRRFNGDISDVRIYATALSDEDIKLLYQPEINIDKSNVVRCSEINEKEMIVSESIKIVSAGYGANQGKYKVSIGDKYSTTERAVGWCVTSIDIDKNITHRTFRTHGVSNEFTALKNYVDKLPLTSTILLSTHDQPSASNTANSDVNCKNWIDYLRNLGATQIDGSFIYRAAYAVIIQERKIIAEGVHNSDTDSMVTLEKIVNLKINKQGFNNNASITYNEFNEVPNIKSGVHNLKLGNETLPVLIDMDNDGGRWARVFYHNCKRGTVLFSNSNAYAEAKEINKNAPTTSDKYSILSKLEHFRPNTKSEFEFKLTYPMDTNSGLNKWTMKQYSKQLSSANVYPLLSDIQGLNPTSSTVIDDTKDFIPNDVGDYYIRHYKTKVYCNIAKTISFQMRNDDSVTIYVNSNIAVQRLTTSTFSDVRLSLNKGWNTLEILYYEHTFNDYFLFNKKISDLVDILDYNGSYNDCNIWKQTSNPTHQKVTRYKPIKIKWTSDFWGGLEYSGGSTFIDGSVNHGNWYYAIGSSAQHLDGIPSARQNANGSTPNDVELWIRINNYDLFADNLIKNVSISRNGVLTAKEFREI